MIDVISVNAPSTFTLYGSTLVPVPVTVVFLPFTSAVFESFNCLTVTASLSSVPSATFLICLLPPLIPVLVILGPSLIVKPLLLIVKSSPNLIEPASVKLISLDN